MKIKMLIIMAILLLSISAENNDENNVTQVINNEKIVLEVTSLDQKKILLYKRTNINESEEEFIKEVEFLANHGLLNSYSQNYSEEDILWNMYKTYEFNGYLENLLDSEQKMESVLNSNGRVVWDLIVQDEDSLTKFFSLTELDDKIRHGSTSFNKESIFSDFYNDNSIINIINENEMYEISEFYRVKFRGMGTLLVIFKYENEFYCINYSAFEDESNFKNNEIYPLNDVIISIKNRLEIRLKAQKTNEFLRNYRYIFIVLICLCAIIISKVLFISRKKK